MIDIDEQKIGDTTTAGITLLETDAGGIRVLHEPHLTQGGVQIADLEVRRTTTFIEESTLHQNAFTDLRKAGATVLRACDLRQFPRFLPEAGLQASRANDHEDTPENATTTCTTVVVTTPAMAATRRPIHRTATQATHPPITARMLARLCTATLLNSPHTIRAADHTMQAGSTAVRQVIPCTLQRVTRHPGLLRVAGRRREEDEVTS